MGLIFGTAKNILSGQGLIVDAVRGAAKEILANKVGMNAQDALNTADKIAARIEAETEMDPAIKNALSLESLFRSRVATGSTGAVIIAGILAYQKWNANEFDDVFFMAIGVVATAGYAFLGRALNWSGPMWSRFGSWLSRRLG